MLILPAMACPYLEPTERMAESAWPKHPRLPLGDPYNGICRADPLHSWTPDAETLRERCNLGYARRRCDRFQEGDGTDAYRFAVIGEHDGTLRIFWVAEREQRPFRDGTLEFSAASGIAGNLQGTVAFVRQARAYAESYLRRKHDPDNDARHPHRR